MGAKASKAKQAKDRQGKLEKVEAQLDAARQLVGGLEAWMVVLAGSPLLRCREVRS